MSAIPHIAANDDDASETREWLDALEAVLEREGPERAHFLLEALIDKARREGAHIPYSANTAYLNTIPPHQEEPLPGDAAIEERIRSYIRWNAMAMVVRANRGEGDLGGHIASYASVNTLMEIGFNHFWRAPTADFGGDLIYFQGHSRAGRVRARVPGRPPHRGAAEQLPARRRRQGRHVLPASEADAGVLAVPDGVDGPRADPGHLHGALPEVPARARHREHRRPQGVGVLRRRRDGRAGVARRHRDGVAREARQPHLRHQLQPAAPRRPGARQRQDHPGARGQLPRRRLEGDQGHLGLVLGSAARAGPRGPAAARDGRDGRRRVPELQGQRRRLRAQALLRQGPEAARDGLAHDRRRHLAAEPRRPRPAQDLRGVSPRR